LESFIENRLDGNDDIELQLARPVAAQRERLEPPTPMPTEPLIFTRIWLPSAATLQGSQPGCGASRPLSHPTRWYYRTNFRPRDFPRRQTTSQFRPVLASRVNASRNLAGNTLGSSTMILAPELEISCTVHWRAAKPPSKVIQPDWRTDLRSSRFLVTAAISIIPTAPPVGREALETVATSRAIAQIPAVQMTCPARY